VSARAIAEAKLGRFLRRRRLSRDEPVMPPPVGALLAETLDLAARLGHAAGGAVLLDDPGRPRGVRAGTLTVVAALGEAREAALGRPGAGAREAAVRDAYALGRTRAVAARGASAARVAVPLVLERAVCGVLVLDAPARRSRFSARDVDIAEVLARSAGRAILNAIDVAKQNELVFRDELTGVRNVRGLRAFVEREVGAALRARSDVAALFCDVDHLKRVNDRLGHQAGSETLRRVGAAMRETVGGSGEVFRFGGDEFVVVVPDADVATARAIAERMRAEVARRTRGKVRGVGALPGVTLSVGVATLGATLRAGDARRDEATRSPRMGSAAGRGSADGEGAAGRGGRAAKAAAERLLVAADRALYRAKHGGRDAVAVAGPRDARAVG
jgi:diguanylate cyclase (GGDEF)-like protein